MGKANRKMNKNKKKKGQEMQSAMVQKLREELSTLFAEEKYSDVINKLAELVQAGDYDPEMLYAGAYSYFMIGDYERAAGMVENVLNFAPGHLAARILLARICILEDRTDDSLAIFDFVLEHSEAQLTQEQREDMEDILEYYGRNEADHLKAEFPHVAAFLGLVPAAMPIAEPAAAPAASASLFSVPVTPAASAAVPEAPAVEVPVAAPEAPQAAAAESVEAEIQAVMGKDASLSDKVRLLQAFAGGHFTAGEYAAAAKFLEAALAIDGQDANVISNLAVLAKRMGKVDKALAFAAKLPQTDFLLLDFLLQK